MSATVDFPPRRARFSLLLLLASILLVAITSALSIASAWRTRANTRQLLRDYAAFAAWSYREQLTSSLGEALWLSLNPIEHPELHSLRQTPPVTSLPIYRAANTARCKCDSPARPATYFRLGFASDSLTLYGAPVSATVEAALPGLVRAAVRGMVDHRSDIIRGLGHDLIAYGTMPTEWGDTIVYGFTFDSAGLDATFDTVLTKASLLPSAVTRGRPNRELLAVEVRDTAGTLFHRSTAWPVDEAEWPFIAQEVLPGGHGDLVVRLTLIPAVAPSLLSGGLPRTPLPLLLLTAVLGLAAAAVALVQLRREAELGRLRSSFVAGVSHELRTPLAQLRLFLDTLRLKRYDTEAEHQWLIGHLTRETTRLEHLVENVLSISRLERRAPVETPLEPLDLCHEVTEAVTAYGPLAASRQVTFAVNAPEPVIVRGDSSTFRQLVLNLLDNAVKFGPMAQEIAIQVHRNGDGQAHLTVADQGPGIPAEDAPHIWESYYRGSHPAVRTVGGSGIGLAIVREAAARLGGSISAANRPGGGAVFTLALPLAEHG